MNNVIPYHPYRYERYCVFAVLCGCIILIIAIGIYIPKIDFTFICLLVITAISIQLIKMLYDFSNITVFLEPDGLRITGGKRDHYCYVPWNEMPYAYYGKSSKSLLYLVLSAEPLSKKHVKQIIRKAEWSLRAKVRINAAIVIKLNEIKEILQFKETIQKNVLRVEEF